MSDVAAPKVQFLFDFGSPNAYLAARVIPAISSGAPRPNSTTCRRCSAASTSSPATVRPLIAFKGIRNKREYMALETERFIARHGITNYSPQSVLPGEYAAIDARRGGRGSRRRVRRVLRGGVSPHVGGAEEDGRSRRDCARR